MDKIIELYKEHGDLEYLGENVSKTTHMIQAAMVAKKNNESDYLILACLLHDIGHFLEEDDMGGLGVIEHGKIGADFLRGLNMDERVCNLVENHVKAKKYLVSKHDEYYDKLSEASKQTLQYQGGKMSKYEMEDFEKQKDFEDILKVRYCDDNGKQIGVDIPPIESFTDLINNHLLYSKYNVQLKEHGYVLLKDFFSDEEANIIIDFKKQLETLPEEKGKWMIYYEKRSEGEYKSRIENFTYYQKNIEKFIKNKIKPLLDVVCQDNMVLFKDKMNWKLPKGDGFKAHQDQPAWSDFDIERFYSVALFTCPSVKENGCLQFVTNKKNIGILSEKGCISSELESQFEWEYMETYPKDLLIFDSYIPHRSDRNNSDNSRSILYFTFNRLSDGIHYKEYNDKKRTYFPPPNERDGKEVNAENNKYNLGNPLN